MKKHVKNIIIRIDWDKWRTWLSVYWWDIKTGVIGMSIIAMVCTTVGYCTYLYVNRPVASIIHQIQTPESERLRRLEEKLKDLELIILKIRRVQYASFTIMSEYAKFGSVVTQRKIDELKQLRKNLAVPKGKKVEPAKNNKPVKKIDKSTGKAGKRHNKSKVGTN